MTNNHIWALVGEIIPYKLQKKLLLNSESLGLGPHAHRSVWDVNQAVKRSGFWTSCHGLSPMNQAHLNRLTQTLMYLNGLGPFRRAQIFIGWFESFIREMGSTLYNRAIAKFTKSRLIKKYKYKYKYATCQKTLETTRNSR